MTLTDRVKKLEALWHTGVAATLTMADGSTIELTAAEVEECFMDAMSKTPNPHLAQIREAVEVHGDNLAGLAGVVAASLERDDA